MSIHFKLFTCLFLFIARRLRRIIRQKNRQSYYVKWISIDNLRCTWEPKSHFVETAAEAKLKEYIYMKEVEVEKAEKRREDILSGNLFVACKHVEEPPTIEPPSTTPTNEVECGFSKTCQNASIGWGHFNGGLVIKRSFFGITRRHCLQRDPFVTYATCMCLLQVRPMCEVIFNQPTRVWLW